MVSRHPLLPACHLAVMVLVVLLPCMSHAATPVVVNPSSVSVRSFLNNFLNGNALNMIHSVDIQFSTTSYARAESVTLKQNYSAASVSKSGVYVTVGQISGFTVEDIMDMMTPYTYLYSSNLYPRGRVTGMMLYYSSRSEATSAYGFSLKSDVPNPTSPVSAVVVIKNTSAVTQSQASIFLDTFHADDVHNRVSGFGVRFKNSTYADAAVALFTTTYLVNSTNPATGITRRSAEDIGVSGLSGFNLNAINGIVSEVFRIYGAGTITDMTLNFGSESTADAMILQVNSGYATGMSSAEKQTSSENQPSAEKSASAEKQTYAEKQRSYDNDRFFLAGGIIGIVIAVIVVGTVVAVGVYWKCFMSSGRDVKEEANIANKDDTAGTTDNANIADKDDTADTTDNANTANKDDTANNGDTADKDGIAADTCITEVFPPPTNQPF